MKARRRSYVRKQLINRLSTLLNVSPQILLRFRDEIENNQAFQSSIRKATGGRSYGQIAFPSYLYAVVRSLTPQTVIETGVGPGVSSAYILSALRANDKGTLYSIDLPNYEKVLVGRISGYVPGHLALIPEGEETGLVIPAYLRNRWVLRIGKSQDVLPALVKELDAIDVFLHDSEHSYENMMFEFRTAWANLNPRGLLLSDDILWNSAFSDFSREVGTKRVYLFGLGAIRKA